MTIVVLLILAVIWAAVLIPPMLGARAEGRPADSIGDFRRQLSVLRRTAPTAVAPAHRLYTPATRPVAAAAVTPRNREAAKRRATIKRRRDVFFALLGSMGATLVLGAVPGLRMLWVLHLMLDVAFVVYVAMLIKVRNDAAERDMKLRFLPTPMAGVPEPVLALRRSANQAHRRRVDRNRGEDLADLAEPVRHELDATHRAREEGLAACRRTIRACGQAIRAVHRAQLGQAQELIGEAGEALRSAQEALRPHPHVAFAGFLHDAEKEYAEAVLTAALVADERLPGRSEIGVGLPAWLNGLAEAASELRRHILDALRKGGPDEAERCLLAMEDIYDLLVTIDYPDAMTSGLRRTTDALRAVLERTRADVTMTVVQGRLMAAIEGQDGAGGRVT